MIVILEGADLVGKTETSKWLGAELRIPSSQIWVELEEPRKAIISVSRTLTRVLSSTRSSIIFDRSVFSEFIYAQVLARDYSYFGELAAEWSNLEDCHLVVLQANESTLRRRYLERGDQYLDIDSIVEANRIYPTLKTIFPSSMGFHLVDVVDGSVEQTGRRIIQALR